MKKIGEKMLTEPEVPNSTSAWTWKNEAHSSRDMLFKNISRIKSIEKKKKKRLLPMFDFQKWLIRGKK